MPPVLGSVDGTADSVGDGVGGSLMSVGVGTGGSVSGRSGGIDTAGKPVGEVVAGSVARGTTVVADGAEDDGRGRPP